MHDHLKIGIVDDLRAKAAKVAAANPRQAHRILGVRAAQPAAITAPILLATAPQKPGRPAKPRVYIAKPSRKPRVDRKYKWEDMSVGDYMDIRQQRHNVTRAVRRAREKFGGDYSITAMFSGVYRIMRTA